MDKAKWHLHRPERGRELLARSLQLDPDQPVLRRMMESPLRYEDERLPPPLDSGSLIPQAPGVPAPTLPPVPGLPGGGL